jgi:hypothetical protein
VIDVDGTISVDLFAIIVVGELANEEGMEEASTRRMICSTTFAVESLNETVDGWSSSSSWDWTSCSRFKM